MVKKNVDAIIVTAAWSPFLSLYSLFMETNKNDFPFNNTIIICKQPFLIAETFCIQMRPGHAAVGKIMHAAVEAKKSAFNINVNN